MPKTVINSLEAWGVWHNKKNRQMAGMPWKSQRPAVPIPVPARPKVEEPAEGREFVVVFQSGGYAYRRTQQYPVFDWLSSEQRLQLERAVGYIDASKVNFPPVAICKLIGYDGTDAECEISVSGYEVPRASLPKWLLDAKRVKVGDRFHWIMRDSSYIGLEDIDTDVGPAHPQLTDYERNRLKELHEEVLRERSLDDQGWEEYTGPSQ